MKVPVILILLCCICNGLEIWDAGKAGTVCCPIIRQIFANNSIAESRTGQIGYTVEFS